MTDQRGGDSDEHGDASPEATCPRCGSSITEHGGTCPDCGLVFLDEDGGLTEEAADALFEDRDLDIAEGTYVPQWVRLLVALAITAPMAPVVLFVVGSVVSLPLWLSGLVFLSGWFLPAMALARLAVPSSIVAAGLVVLGATLASTPVLIVVGRTILGVDAQSIGAFGSDAWAAQTAFLAVGSVVLVLGVFLYRYAGRKRNQWARDRQP